MRLELLRYQMEISPLEEFLELDIISQNPALADSWSRAIVLTRDSLLSLLVRCWSQIVELSELREMALS